MTWHNATRPMGFRQDQNPNPRTQELTFLTYTWSLSKHEGCVLAPSQCLTRGLPPAKHWASWQVKLWAINSFSLLLQIRCLFGIWKSIIGLPHVYLSLPEKRTMLCLYLSSVTPPVLPKSSYLSLTAWEIPALSLQGGLEWVPSGPTDWQL